MKTCKHCGSQLEEQAKFCRYCGKPAAEETPYNYQQQDTGYGYGGQQPGDQVYQSSSYNQNYSGYQQQYSQPSYNQQAYNQQLYNQQPYKQGGKTCGMAVASLVLGLVGIFLGYLGAAFSAAASFPGMGFMWIIAIAFFYAKHTGCSVRNLNMQNKGTGSHRQGAGHRRAGSGDCIPGHLGHCSSFCRAGNRNLWLLFQRSVLLMNPMITQQVL